MACRPLRIGFLGPVNESSSEHASSISRAIEIAQSELAAFANGTLEVCVGDDGANAAGGRAAAKMLLDKGIDIAAGLFSSAAATAAIPLLAGHCSGVVIAGANLDGLTSEPNVFRVCDNAADYAGSIARILEDLPVCAVEIHHEPSEFGRSIGRMLPARRNCERTARGKAIACIGQFHFAGRILQEVSAALEPGDIVLLTDDCQSDRKVRMIAENLPGIRILVAGFSVRPAPDRSWAREAALRRWGEEPAAFFHETIASIEAAAHLARHGSLEGEVATVFGDLTFDQNREARPNRMVLYCGTDKGLTECPTSFARP